ncbi:MAG TPA: RtcB family protein [Pirellulales bacterium]|jgi:tRNA-splicing ligase RtcB|nr:RtcB family protein [Pirellulales bacterium]
MNSRQLEKLGVPIESRKAAIVAIQNAASAGILRSLNIDQVIRDILANPAGHVDDPNFGPFAQSLLEAEAPAPAREPIAYRTWGESGIDPESHVQMRQACALPMATGAALMPDAHVGYGLPIGGVLALEGAVVPYAVGVDIACRMKLSVFDMPAFSLTDRLKFDLFERALEKGTRFGVGSVHQKPQDHPIMEQNWSVTRVTRENKDKAWRQLGTSGSGNHFVEFGLFSLPADDAELGLAAGEYVALLSHSGSRGTGASVCSTYSAIARARLPKKYEALGRLAWLDLDSEAGQEYWAAMNLMGDYAAANHDVIHRLVSKLLGAKIIAGVENHHNFAWKEMHGGREVIVHRKGATPADRGQLGVIPGSMADPAFVVRGRGCAESLNSASHGAGRRMSRTAAKKQYTWRAVQKNLEQRGVKVLSAGADEVPGVYKNIEDVMREQQDLVEVVARFDPKIVKMCGDGSAAED